MKRVDLIVNYKEFQAGSTIEVENEEAAKLIKRGKGKLAAQQTIYVHENEMPREVREKARLALEAADAAGGYRDQAARAAATAPFRDSK